MGLPAVRFVPKEHVLNCTDILIVMFCLQDPYEALLLATQSDKIKPIDVGLLNGKVRPVSSTNKHIYTVT